MIRLSCAFVLWGCLTVNDYPSGVDIVRDNIPVKELDKLLGLSYSRVQALLTELDIPRFRLGSGTSKYISHPDFVMLQHYQHHTKNGGTLQQFKETYEREIPTQIETSAEPLLTPQESRQDLSSQSSYTLVVSAFEDAIKNTLPQAIVNSVSTLKERLEVLLLIANENIPIPSKDLANTLGISSNTLRSKASPFSLYGFEFHKEKRGTGVYWKVRREEDTRR